jgi:hypothetical protein
MSVPMGTSSPLGMGGISSPLRMSQPFGFVCKGTHIHVSLPPRNDPDPHPHLTGDLNGEKIHVHYFGQTTLGMFDQSLPGNTVPELKKLKAQFPWLFKDSGLEQDPQHEE